MRRCYAFLAFLGVQPESGVRRAREFTASLMEMCITRGGRNNRNPVEIVKTLGRLCPSPLAHRSNSRNHGQGQRTEGHGLRPGDRDDEERVRSPARPRPLARPPNASAPSAALLLSRAPLSPPRRNRKLTKMECMVNYHLARVPFWNGKESVAMANAEKCAAQPQSRCLPCAGRGPRASSCPLPPCQDP